MALPQTIIGGERLPMGIRIYAIIWNSFEHRLAPGPPTLVVMRVPPTCTRLWVDRGHVHLYVHTWRGSLNGGRRRDGNCIHCWGRNQIHEGPQHPTQELSTVESSNAEQVRCAGKLILELAAYNPADSREEYVMGIEPKRHRTGQVRPERKKP